MPQLSPTDKRKNARINAYDFIQATGYDKTMQPIAEISNSGFSTTRDVIRQANKRIFPDKVAFIRITNDSKNWCYLFDSTGKRVDMTDETI